MQNQLDLEIGQCSIQGAKNINQDFYGAYLPSGHVLKQKGVVCAIADGISSSNVSHIASETAIVSFINDYFSTPDSWGVKKSAERVIYAINSWLYAQTQQSIGRFDKDQGYISTLTVLIMKQSTAHIFHIGDSRVYRIRNNQLECLTTEHRVQVSPTQSYLSRALGMSQRVDIDYLKIDLMNGDRFVLMTDGIYEFLSEEQILAVSKNNNKASSLDINAEFLVQQALEKGSLDNLTVQIVQVNQTELSEAFVFQDSELKFMDELSIGSSFEGYQILKNLHHNHRSQIYLAYDPEKKNHLIIKIPSSDLQNDPRLLEQFHLEEWVSKRISNENVMANYMHCNSKNYAFQTYEYISGKNLSQIIRDNRKSFSFEEVLNWVEQIAKGLNAFHRLEMLHQDIRPENIILTDEGKIKIIDFGSTAVRGLAEINPEFQRGTLGTLAFMAPEYFVDEPVSVRSDQFSLAVLTYYLLSSQLPYGTELARCKKIKQLKTVHYHSLVKYRPDLPMQLDLILKKALSVESRNRYVDLSEFIYDLKHLELVDASSPHQPLAEKNPVKFWQCVAGLLFMLLLFMLALMFK